MSLVNQLVHVFMNQNHYHPVQYGIPSSLLLLKNTVNYFSPLTKEMRMVVDLVI